MTPDDIAAIRAIANESFACGPLIMSVAKFNELRLEAGAEPLDWPDLTALVIVEGDEVRLLGDDSE